MTGATEPRCDPKSDNTSDKTSDTTRPDLSALDKIDPPPALVARVMTRLAEPRPVSLWEWLGRPFTIEIRLSPITLLALALALAAAFVLIGATLE